jgi:hypothetical protein
VRTPSDLDEAFNSAKRGGADSLVMLSSPLIAANWRFVEHDRKGGLNFQPAVLVQIGGGEREDDAKLLEGGLANYRLRSLGGVGGP